MKSHQTGLHLLAAMGFCLCAVSPAANAGETVLKCDGMWGSEQYFPMASNLVKLVTPVFFDKKIFVKPRENFDWDVAKIRSIDDVSFSFESGWGIENTKDCKGKEFNVSRQESWSVVYRKPDSAGRYKWKSFYVSDTCFEGKQYKKDELEKEGYCVKLEGSN
jgi:hypothetical protein